MVEYAGHLDTDAFDVDERLAVDVNGDPIVDENGDPLTVEDLDELNDEGFDRPPSTGSRATRTSCGATSTRPNAGWSVRASP